MLVLLNMSLDTIPRKDVLYILFGKTLGLIYIFDAITPFGFSNHRGSEP